MLAEIFLRHREEVGRQKGRAEGFKKGRAEGREIGREEVRRLIASWPESMTDEELLAEIDRLIVEARKDGRRHLAARMGRMNAQERLAEIDRLIAEGRKEERRRLASRPGAHDRAGAARRDRPAHRGGPQVQRWVNRRNLPRASHSSLLSTHSSLLSTFH